jgi:hypothetical protein
MLQCAWPEHAAFCRFEMGDESAGLEGGRAGGLDPLDVEAFDHRRRRSLASSFDRLLDGRSRTLENAVDRPIAHVPRMPGNAKCLCSPPNCVAIENALDPSVGDDVCGNQFSHMPGVGLEPTRPQGHSILSAARLPIPPPGQGARGNLNQPGLEVPAAQSQEVPCDARANPGPSA